METIYTIFLMILIAAPMVVVHRQRANKAKEQLNINNLNIYVSRKSDL